MKRYIHPSVHCSTILIVKTQKQLKCPSTDEQTKKMWYTYKMKYYSAIIQNKIMAYVATQMELAIIIILNEVKDKFIHGI